MSANIDLIVKRLLDPQSGSNITERSLMGSAADAIRYLCDEKDRLQALLDRADRGSPAFRAIERVLDEHSAWISRPSREVTAHIALAACIAFDVTTRNEAAIQFDRAEAAEARLAASLRALEWLKDEPEWWDTPRKFRDLADAALFLAKPTP